MNKKIYIILAYLLMGIGLFGFSDGSLAGYATIQDCENDCFAVWVMPGPSGGANMSKYDECVAGCPGTLYPPAGTCASPCSPTQTSVPNGSGGTTQCTVCAPAGTCPTACGSPASTVPNGSGGTLSCPATEACSETPAVGTQTAAPTQPSTPAPTETATQAGNVPNLNANSGSGVKIDDPLNLGPNPIPALAKRLILAALGLTGVLALLSFIYGGILYMLVGVSADNVKKGKEVMKWSVIGLFVIFSAYAILDFILGTVLGLTR